MFSAQRLVMRVLGLAVCLLVVTGCDEKSPTGPTVPFNQQVTLAPSQVATVEGSNVRLQFVAVTGDSRCPADAVCILGGDALVEVRASSGNSTTTYQIHTGNSSLASATHDSVRFSLVQLQPYPFSSRTISPDEYRATLEITRP
jgi:hypothetical protein